MSDAVLPAAPPPPALASTPSAPVLRGNRCQCTGCGDLFNSTSTFDRHRTGRYDVIGARRCLTSEELTARGWSRNAAGFWIERPMRRRLDEATQQVSIARPSWKAADDAPP
jgi:hypothetical protein